MKKVFCDICGKEITNQQNTWTVFLSTTNDNPKRKYNSRYPEICEECTAAIYNHLEERKTR